MTARGQSGRVFPIRFIEPGLVRYNDVGNVLVTKETLDKMSASFVGKPIFNEAHRDVTSGDFKDGKADGVIGRVYYNSTDGWYWADAIVWDGETIDNIKNGYSLSCAYDVPRDSWGPGGIHNNIPYDREVMNGEYTHLAIVTNPRYERARIIYNQGGSMNLKFWKKEQKAEEKPSEVELANAVIEVEGKETKIEDLIAGFKAAQKRQEELANAAPKKLGLEDSVDIDGKKVLVKDLVSGFKANLQNASDEDMKDAHKDGKHEDKKAENCKMCNEADEEKKKDEERKNAEAKDKKDEEERKNSLAKAEKDAADARKHFDDLKNAAQNRKGDFKTPDIRSQADRVAEGQKRYGPKN